MTSGTAPFVLLDDARPGGRASLYSEPAEIIQTRDPAEVSACLETAGAAATPPASSLMKPAMPWSRSWRRWRRPAADAPPLLWFGLFERADRSTPPISCPIRPAPGPGGCGRGSPRPTIGGRWRRCSSTSSPATSIRPTSPSRRRCACAGHPLALYAGLRERARAGHGALIFTGAHWILSLSPELFFTLDDGRVTTRPMKGTAGPATDPARLRDDPKQRAENLMIVDLLRNDLSRVARPGTVEVPELFAVETYPTVLQMTSTVTGRARRRCGPGRPDRGHLSVRLDHRRAQDPGDGDHPRARAEPRGVYCGAIGGLAPDGQAAFNVASGR